MLVPPKHFPKTLCNGGFGPTGVCVLAKSVNTNTGAVLTPVRNDTVTGLLVTDGRCRAWKTGWHAGGRPGDGDPGDR